MWGGGTWNVEGSAWDVMWASDCHAAHLGQVQITGASAVTENKLKKKYEKAIYCIILYKYMIYYINMYVCVRFRKLHLHVMSYFECYF